MSLRKLTKRILSALIDLQQRVGRLEKAVFSEEDPKMVPKMTLFDRQMELDEFDAEG